MHEDDDHEDVEPSPPRLKKFRETMECLEDVRSFLESNGNMAEATKAEELVNNVAWLQCSTTRYTVQEKITSYFQPGSSTTYPSPPTYSLPIKTLPSSELRTHLRISTRTLLGPG